MASAARAILAGIGNEAGIILPCAIKGSICMARSAFIAPILSGVMLLGLDACATSPRPTDTAAAPAPAAAPSDGGNQAVAPVVAPQVVVDIYRGVKVLANTTNIDWSNNSFGVSGPVPNLSFFNAMGGGQACWLRVPVTVAAVPVPVNGGGTVTLTTVGVVNAQPSPWPAVFDNVPAGHWHIDKTAIAVGAVSNAMAGTIAGQVFRASQAAGQVTIVDGTVANCQP
jgi:hypothetical protein